MLRIQEALTWNSRVWQTLRRLISTRSFIFNPRCPSPSGSGSLARLPAVPVGFRLSELYRQPKENWQQFPKRHLRLIPKNDYSSKQLLYIVVIWKKKKHLERIWLDSYQGKEKEVRQIQNVIFWFLNTKEQLVNCQILPTENLWHNFGS